MNNEKHKKFEYNKIIDQIYLGTNSCCITHFSEELLSKGITADISLEGERLDQPEGVDYYLWLPVEDHTAPTMKQLKTGIACIEELINNNVKIYLHCKNGHGRSPTLLAAYFIFKGMQVQEAIDKIAEKRTEIHIEEPQLKLLQQYYQELNK